MINGNWIRNSKDYLRDIGCCLTCNQKSDGCWCSSVKCHQCDWYKGKNEWDKGDNEYFEKLEGYCIFPSSNFSLPCNEEISIEIETEKAFLIKLTNHSFWIPKKACIIRKNDDGFEWITIKGWFILLKENEYNNKKEKTEKDEILSELFYNISIEEYID